MYDIITIGSATRDVFLRSAAWETHASDHSPTGFEQCLPLGAKVPIDEIHFATGGGAANTAVTFARLGKLRTACVCRIGAMDTGGQAVLDDLRRERVDTRAIQRDPKRHTAYSLIVLSGSGERTILVHRGASGALDANMIPWEKLRARWISVTSLAGNLALMRKLLAHARRIGARVAWNPGGAEIARGWQVIAPLAAQCAVFSLNREEAAALTGCTSVDLGGMLSVLHHPLDPSVNASEAQASIPCPAGHGIGSFFQQNRLRNRTGEPRKGYGVHEHAPCTEHVVLITDGADGAYASNTHTTWHIASRKLRVVNTTGAGDAFGSAFVLGLIRGLEPPDALRLAMANAEGVITHMGAKTGILRRVPTRAALAKYRVLNI